MVTTVSASSAEVATGTFSKEKIAATLEALAADGVVGIGRAISLEHIDALAEKMLADLEAFDASPRGPIVNHWQGLRPPPAHPHLYRDIVFNEQLIAVLRELMGPDIVLTSYGANTAFAVGDPEKMQQPHIDHPEPQPPGPVDAVAINIPVVDVTEDNGATMYWPGSHLAGEMLSSRNPTEEQTASWPRGAARTVCERGTILVRDLRVWHRGMPNLTSTHRPMITLVVKRHLNAPGDSNQRLGFEADASTEEFWLHPRLQTAAWLFEGPIDYFHLDGHSKPANRPDASLARKLHPEMPGSTQTRGRL